MISNSRQIQRLFRSYRAFPIRKHSTKPQSPASPSNVTTVTRITNLPNGLRVVTDDIPGYFAAIGAYLDAGSRYEWPEFYGYSHLMEKLAFKSTMQTPRDKVMNVLERIGGNVMCTNSREHIMYQATVFKSDIPDTLQLISETIQTPDIKDDELQEAYQTINYEMQQVFSKPEWLVPELAHRTAYLNNTYGLPSICLPDTIQSITKDKIHEFRSYFYKPKNIVISGVGIDHDYLVQLVSEKFAHMPAGKDLPSIEKVKYTGGTQHHEDKTSELSRFFIGFESCSFLEDDVYPISVLQMMLGGGDSFSAGGPGKGMYSRLYTNVLNQYHWVESITATNSIYKDSGLFGFQMTVPHELIANAMTLVGIEIRKILDKPISSIELERSKNQLRSNLFMTLESKLMHAEDLGRQVQLQGHRTCPKEMSEKVEQVTADDLKRVVGKMVKEKSTFMVLGNPKFAPDISRFERVFGFGKYS